MLTNLERGREEEREGEEGGREREKEREKQLCEKETSIRYLDGLPLVHTPTRDQTHSLGMCPDWESNLQPFGLQDDAPTNWATLAKPAMFTFKKTVHADAIYQGN